MKIVPFTDAELESFNRAVEEFEDEDTLVDAVIPVEKECVVEDWEMQSCDSWIAQYNEAQALNNLRVIEHWFYFTETDGTTRVRGITKDETGADRIVTTSMVHQVLNDVLWTASGSKYRLIHQIRGENVDDICEFWPMFQGC